MTNTSNVVTDSTGRASVAAMYAGLTLTLLAIVATIVAVLTGDLAPDRAVYPGSSDAELHAVGVALAAYLVTVGLVGAAMSCGCGPFGQSRPDEHGHASRPRPSSPRPAASPW